MVGIEDKRAIGLPNVPYSAYCRECWEPMYSLWTDSEEHSGLCTTEAATGQPCARKLRHPSTPPRDGVE